jgi:pimeloyl-ACP methyl ester carboxylesterase
MTTFVLVHGAWHGGWCWRHVAARLRAAGHEVHAPTLTGLGERAHLLSPEVGLDTHVRDVLGLLEYEDLRHAVLVGHSYGGIVITAVAERAAARLSHLLYLDAFVPEDGQAQADLVGPAVVARYREAAQRDGGGYAVPPLPLDAFGLLAPEDRTWAASRVGPHPLRTQLEPVRLGDPAAAALPRTYVYCNAPASGPFEQFAARFRTHPAWRYHELATRHDAMITAPGPLTELLLAVASSPSLAGG